MESGYDILYLTPEEFAKSRINSREIRVCGEMYDIKKIDTIDKKLVIKAFRDDAEENILSAIKEFLKKTNTTKEQLPLEIQQMMEMTYLASFLKILQPYLSPAKNEYAHHHYQILILNADIPTPPPKKG